MEQIVTTALVHGPSAVTHYSSTFPREKAVILQKKGAILADFCWF